MSACRAKQIQHATTRSQKQSGACSYVKGIWGHKILKNRYSDIFDHESFLA